MFISQTQKLSVFFPLFLLALGFFALSSVILLSGTAVLAETRYIKPSSEIVVRKGQGVKFKVIAMIKDGASVELLAEDDSYARVRLSNGKEGWVLKRFLSATPPLVDVVASLRSEKKELKQKEAELMQNITGLSSSLAETRKELDSTVTERNQMWADFQTLQRETADVVKIKNELLETRKNNKHLTQELASTKKDGERLRKNFAIKWFLAGGSVLLLGMLIGGVLAGKSRRKTSLQL